MRYPGSQYAEIDVREQRPLDIPDSAVPVVTPAARQQPVVASPTGSMPRRPLSAGQIRAIFDVMRTFRDDDVSRIGDIATFVCDRCMRRRQLAGSLVYGDLRLCNGCATDYELLRTAGLEFDILAAGEAQHDG